MNRELKPVLSSRITPAIHRVRVLLAGALLSIAFPLSGLAADPVPGTDLRPVGRADSAMKLQTAERVARLKQTREQFLAAAAAPLPDGLSAEQRVEAKRYMVWLRVCAAHMEAIAAQGDGGGSQAQLPGATKDMQATQEAFSRQYLQLQDSMQNENRQYVAASTLLKSTHDSVKNSISNLR
ncbi:MAG: hypothetical protein ABIW30_02415 [Arenimonas sp.]